MKKSKKNYRIAFVISLTMLPFVVLMDRETLRQWWFIAPLLVTMFTMFFFAFRGMMWEGRGE